MALAMACLSSAEILVFAWALLQVEFTKNKAKLVIGAMLIIAAIGIETWCPNVNIGMLLGHMILPMFGVVLLFNERILKGVLKYWFCFLYMELLYLPVSLVFKFVINILDIDATVDFERVVCNMLVVLVMFCIGHFIKRKNELVEWIREIQGIYFVLGIICGITVSGIGSFVGNMTGKTSGTIRVIVDSMVTVLSIFIYLMGIAFAFVDLFRKKYKSENEVKNKYLLMSKEYYNQQLQHMNEVRSIRHDIKAHMTILRGYVENKAWEEAEDYLKQITEHQELSQEKMVDVGNEIINAIIMETVGKNSASGDNVAIECVGMLPAGLNISEYDLCTIFSNLIANGVEACSRLVENEKVLRIVFKEDEGLVRILFENPIEWKVDVNKIGTYTSKKEKEQHGYGIGNVQKTVSRHGGSMVIQATDGKFKVVIVINKSDNE